MNLGIDRLKTVSELAQRLTTILRKLIARVSSIESKIESGEIGGGSDSGPANLDDKVPVGSIQPFAGEKGSIPNKWLLCDGSAISRSTYPQLFSIIGETYGAGDGSTTFNLPDLRGEFIRGFDDGRGVDSGRTLGSFQDHELESHRHAIPNMRLVTGGDYAHLRWTEGSSSQIKNTNFTGGSETRPRNIAMNYIIRVDVDTSPAPVAYEVPDGSIVEAKLADGSVTADKIPTQKRVTKYLPSDLTSNDTDISTFRFTGLTVGKNYKLFVQATFIVGNASAELQVVHDGSVIMRMLGSAPTETHNDRSIIPGFIEFIATGSTVTFNFKEFSTAILEGNGTTEETWAFIQETPYNVLEVASF